MTFTYEIILCAIAAYLLGSIPSAVWFGKIFYGIDVREHGSGNAGATNTLRILGNKAGFIVLGLDLLKGYFATNLVLFLPDLMPDSNTYFMYQILLGAISVIGHVYPVFAGFRGGKGIATLTGILIALNYQLAIFCFLTFVIIVSITRYISVGSMLSALLSPLFVLLLNGWQFNALFYFCAVVSVLVIYTHRANIGRLVNGNENRFSFKKKTTV
jgi:glycerol-3-phosphate acyltransferase PlsY